MLLSNHTTLRLGGPAAESVLATDEFELIEHVRTADAAGIPVLVLGGGSNLVVADAGFEGRVVQVGTTGVTVADAESDGPQCGGTMVEVAAGEPWSDFVVSCARRGRVGVEALIGIPGLVGATPIQNVGAYGQEVSDTIARVRTWDRESDTIKTFAAADCGFGYRTSRFKEEPGRYLVLAVTFQFPAGSLGAPIAYAELARTLGVEVGERAPLGDVQEAVLTLRSSKGMVLEASDHDTWSAGSFFTNPIVEPARVPDGAPSWPAGEGLVKTSAAWLIDHAGFSKGHRLTPDASISLSTKHALALTNRGDASTAELLELARSIRGGVQSRYGIELVPEPTLINCSLD